MYSGGLYSTFLYNSSLAAHMLTVFKTSTMDVKTTHPNAPQRTYAAIATLY